ncbi:MFS transporter [Nocardioides sp. LML1-1-1.1]
MRTDRAESQKLWRRLVPPTRLGRRLAAQTITFTTGEGAFNTGSAVFLTQVVGMSASRVGLALTLVNVAEFLLAYPAGRVVDRLGPRRVWAVSMAVRGACFLALPFVGSFGAYLLVGTIFAAFSSAAQSGFRAYVVDVLPPESRVETQAHLYSAVNLGFTLGAIVGGLALATGDLDVIRWSPVFAAALTILSAVRIAGLPAAPHDLRVASGEARVRPPGPGPLRNRGWVLLTFCLGVLWTNQTLLHVVIPLWLVTATDAPHVLLAWLYGTNTVLCILLPAYTSKGARDLPGGLRYVWLSSGFFVASCLLTWTTHSTVGLVTVLLVWLGHVAVTAAELTMSGASWAFQSELMDPRRRGEYQGVAAVTRAMGSMWAPALFTVLAMKGGGVGWLVIGAIVAGAAVLTGPSLRLAVRFRDQHFPVTEEDQEHQDAAEERATSTAAENRSTGAAAGA